MLIIANNLFTVVLGLVSVDVVVLVGGDPLRGCVLHAGLILRLRHPLTSQNFIGYFQKFY